MTRFAPFHQQLNQLAAAGRQRILVQPTGRDFSSNDYLGLARSPYLQDVARAAIDAGIPHGSGGSRLLGGNHPEHEALERFAAAHYGAEAALFFSTGYAANLALFSTLPQARDLVLYDSLIHASSHDGMKLGRASTAAFRHNDCDDLEGRIKAYRQSGRTGTVWIAVESLYSMDGDQAPLAQLANLANRYDAMLIIDEAHAVGVFGDRGKGLSDCLENSDNIIVMRTCGKALGVEGGLLTLASVLRDFFVNRARPFIFSTAPSPLTAHLVHQAIAHVADEPGLRQRLHELIRLAEDRLAMLCPSSRQNSQIFPIILGEDRHATRLAGRLQKAGFDVRAIRPPTVPAGTARLRLSLSLNITANDIITLAEALLRARAEGEAA